MSIPLKDPSKGAIVLGTTQRQHMIAIGHIPPGTGPFEAHLANELVGRLNPPTAQRIPRTALRAIIDAGLIVFQVPDQLIDRRRGLPRGRPRALQPPNDAGDLARKQPCHGGFYPFQGLLRLVTIVGGRDLIDVLGAVIVVQDHLGGREQWLDALPDPLGAIGYDTQAEGVFRNQPRVFDLAQGSKQFLMILNLMPTEQMDDAVVIHQVEAKALGFAPLALPAGALSAGLFAPRAMAFGLLRASGQLSSINGQDPNRPPATSRGHSRNLGQDLLAR